MKTKKETICILNRSIAYKPGPVELNCGCVLRVIHIEGDQPIKIHWGRNCQACKQTKSPDERMWHALFHVPVGRIREYRDSPEFIRHEIEAEDPDAHASCPPGCQRIAFE